MVIQEEKTGAGIGWNWMSKKAELAYDLQLEKEIQEDGWGSFSDDTKERQEEILQKVKINNVQKKEAVKEPKPE